jgi:UTP--glucose-1-phosphate uridylyltransferase
VSDVRKAVITAAGRGTRHFPATRTVQKELFPLVDRDGVTKPVLQIVAEEALDAGIERICIVCSPASIGPVRDHFSPVTEDLRRSLAGKPAALAQCDRLDRLAQVLEWAVQPAPDGYGDAVLHAQEFVGDEPFLLMLGDHVYISDGPQRCAASMIAAYERMHSPVSGVIRTPTTEIRLFGTVTGERLIGEPPVYRVTGMMEKPTTELAAERLKTRGLGPEEYLTFFGMHILPPTVFEPLANRKRMDDREDGEIQLTSSLAHLATESEYYVVEIAGRRLDMGVPEGLVHTQEALWSSRQWAASDRA